MTKGPRVLLFDIETAPILGYIWRLWDQTVALNQIASDWYVLASAAKWLGEDEVMYLDQRSAKDIENDRPILKFMWDLLDEADIVITQNGKAFDSKKLNARFVISGFKPPSSYRHIDTKILAKKHFAFTSNKLEYLADKLCIKYKKLKHNKFPGFELWRECLKGNQDAWREMEKYNKWDVLTLEEVYCRLRAWDTTVTLGAYHAEHVCQCGSRDLRKRGYYYTNINKYQRYKCNLCGAEFRDRTSAMSNEDKKKLTSGTNRS